MRTILLLLIAAATLIVIFDKSVTGLESADTQTGNYKLRVLVWLTAVMAAIPCAGLVVLSAAWLTGAL